MGVVMVSSTSLEMEPSQQAFYLARRLASWVAVRKRVIWGRRRTDMEFAGRYLRSKALREARRFGVDGDPFRVEVGFYQPLKAEYDRVLHEQIQLQESCS